MRDTGEIKEKIKPLLPNASLKEIKTSFIFPVEFILVAETAPTVLSQEAPTETLELKVVL